MKNADEMSPKELAEEVSKDSLLQIYAPNMVRLAIAYLELEKKLEVAKNRKVIGWEKYKTQEQLNI